MRILKDEVVSEQLLKLYVKTATLTEKTWLTSPFAACPGKPHNGEGQNPPGCHPHQRAQPAACQLVEAAAVCLQGAVSSLQEAPAPSLKWTVPYFLTRWEKKSYTNQLVLCMLRTIHTLNIVWVKVMCRNTYIKPLHIPCYEEEWEQSFFSTVVVWEFPSSSFQEHLSWMPYNT